MSKVVAAILLSILTMLMFCSCTISKKKPSILNTNEINTTIMDSLQNDLEAISTMTPQDFNPMFFTAVADRLASLGKDDALIAVEEFVHHSTVHTDHFGLFLLLRMLFEVPTTHKHPEIRIGKFDYDMPNAEDEANLFPIVYSNKIPFLLVTGYFTGGFPQPINDHTRFYRDFGILKDTAHHVPIEKSEDILFHEFSLVWSKMYHSDTIPDALAIAIKEQIRKALTYQKSARN
ncbi:hypothetical protein KORDIASMS9_03358 [Kordia sp. SMS9]|uniref:hypothetical protein n=1 Tax=Kordia sp. SMS9 TaxID=2282170 RepID=UPI000E1063BC|nr:hypothetical protein [Kordia sp. SMS9]AXG71103.1 hypothetical protein KORDIASMS9_03358 [Kordia sp. SMS9]